MPISKFVQPNFTDPTVDGSSYKTAIDNSIKLMSQVAAQFACCEQTPLAMALDIRAGTIFADNNVIQIAEQTVSFDAAPSGTSKRIDRVVVNAYTGVASVVKGTESTTPIAPTIAAGLMPIASVLISANQNAITNYDITDERLSGISYWGENTSGFATFGGALTLNQATGVSPIDLGIEAKNIARVDFFIGGIPQKWTTSFTLNADTSKITIVGGSSSLQGVEYWGRVHVASAFTEINQPSPNSVGPAQLQDDSVNLETKVYNNLSTEHLDDGDNADESTFWRGDGKWAGIYNRKAIFEHRLPAGTNGGTITAGSWFVRAINTTTYNDIPDASLSANRITLPAGTYDIRASVQGNYCGAHKIRLYNTTDSVMTVQGMNYCSVQASNTTLGSDTAELDGRFVINKTTSFEIQHICQASRANEGQGYGSPGSGWGIPEIFVQVIVEKLL